MTNHFHFSDSLKRCFKCGIEQPRSEFYRHPMMADGLLGKCKTCTKADVAKNYYSRYRQKRDYDRLRGQRPCRRAKQREYSRRYGEANAQRRSAHYTLGNAVRDGRVKRQPCVVCGDLRAEGHHSDYSKPFDVQWLCFKHHRQVHGQLQEVTA